MKFHLFLFIIFYTLSVWAQDSKEIVIATESWEKATNRDGTGLYWDIIDAVYRPLGYTIVKKHTSYTKATQMVQHGQADLWLAAYKDEKDFALYPKHHFDQDVVIALYRSETIEKWQGEKSLKGLKVAWIRGYDYDKYLTEDVEKVEVNSRENGLKLLKSERIGVLLDDRQDLAETLKNYKEFKAPDYLTKIVMQLKLYPAFSNSDKGRKLSKEWDERMHQLIQTEPFKRLYFSSEYALFPY